MTEKNKKQKTSNLPVLIIIAVVAVITVAYWFVPTLIINNAKTGSGQTSATNSSKFKALATGPMKSFVVHKTRQELKKFTFKNGEGKELSVADWKGRVMLMNLWATWCAPCRKEMPHLADLQKQLGSDKFEVVAISVDRKGLEASKAFLLKAGADNLKIYLDRSTEVLGKMHAPGLPATILIDKNGKEIGRLLGPAVWNSPEAIKMIKAAIDE